MVHLHLQVRRFRCPVPTCRHRVFAARLGMPASPSTLLRLIRQMALPAHPPVREIGVDDFALRRGQRYGTVIVDHERRRPIDLLPDRTADTLATWLQRHDTLTTITRDRSTEYARGIAAGAPHAVEVLDRWHLQKNLREAVERVLTRQQQAVRGMTHSEGGGMAALQERLRAPPPRAQGEQAARRPRASSDGGGMRPSAPSMTRASAGARSDGAWAAAAGGSDALSAPTPSRSGTPIGVSHVCSIPSAVRAPTLDGGLSHRVATVA